jgi:hypothetical protein
VAHIKAPAPRLKEGSVPDEADDDDVEQADGDIKKGADHVSVTIKASRFAPRNPGTSPPNCSN